jgi:hypothetical protein
MEHGPKDALPPLQSHVEIISEERFNELQERARQQARELVDSEEQKAKSQGRKAMYTVIKHDYRENDVDRIYSRIRTGSGSQWKEETFRKKSLITIQDESRPQGYRNIRLFYAPLDDVREGGEINYADFVRNDTDKDFMTREYGRWHRPGD